MSSAMIFNPQPRMLLDNATSAYLANDTKTDKSEHHLVIVAFVLILLLMFSMLVSYFVTHKMKITWLPEAGCVLLVGMLFGAILHYSDEEKDFEELHNFKTQLVCANYNCSHETNVALTPVLRGTFASHNLQRGATIP
jgi:glucan phosphoethanolaminetransferase (alkaline phosphatase superfamily)